MTSPHHSFDPERLLRILVEHQVRFVLIGGWAAKLQGSPTVTVDIDICHARELDNLEVRLRGVDDEVPFTLDARSLRAGDSFTLTTSVGDIDLIATPAGSGGFEALMASADTLELDDLRISVASLDDIIAMKRAAGRPKDLIEVEVLEALRTEAESGGEKAT